MAESITDYDPCAVTRIDGFRGQSAHAKRQAKGQGMTIDKVTPLVTPGDYQMVYVGRYTEYLHGHCAKLALKFRIIEPGSFFEVELQRWFNCQRLVGKPGKNGRFIPPRHGDFLLEYSTLFPLSLTRSTRLDRITFTPFKNCIITGRVDTVTSNAKQKALPEALQYSTIRELLRVGA